MMQVAVTQALRTCGGSTQSVFPRAEAWLLAETENQEALEFVAGRKKVGRYESMMDFLFCEIFTEHQRACRRYYAGMGPQLKELISPQDVIRFEERLLVALELAAKLRKEERQVSWGWFRREALTLAA